jgi:outer membrane protein TolC
MMQVVIAVVLLGAALGEEPARARRITLEEAQAQAVAANAARLAQLSIDAARLHREAAQADYFPKVDSIFTNLHFNKFMGQLITVGSRTVGLPLLNKNQTTATFTVTQPITPLLKVRQAVAVARADEAIAKAKADELKAQVALDVERTYFELLIAKRQGGRNTRELNQALNVLVGFSEETELELVPPLPMTATISLEEATQQALANSAAIVEAEQTVVKARAAARVSKLSYIPDVAVIGGYTYQTALPLLPKDFTYIGAIATLNIFDFGKREKTIAAAKTELQIAEANVQMVRAKVAASAQKAFFELQRAGRMRDLTRRLVTTVRYEPEDEKEMFQAELDYRIAFSQLRQIAEGR